MSYSLGLDLGTTNSAAAIADEQGVRMLSIGHDGPIVESVVHLSVDGSITVGRAAARRAEGDPAGVAREFKRRFGDTTPLLLHGTPVAANDLTLQLATHLVAAATTLQGAPPSELVVCHPANWGAFKTSLLSDTFNNSALPPHQLITEPEAAAIHYASQARVADGTTIAVYDLGGGTFDVAILRKLPWSPSSRAAQSGDLWERIGRPGGIERLGGIDFDTAIFQHVLHALDLDLDTYDDNDIAAQAAVGRLRADCTEAKHTLSDDSAATVSVLLPGRSEQVRITRGEFERLIGPAIVRSLDTFDNTLSAAGLTYEQLDRILMVGGSSRIPVVAERVASHTGRPLATDAHPKHAFALGAAAFAVQRQVSDAPSSDDVPSDQAPTPTPTPTPTPSPAAPPISPEEEALLRQPLGGMFQELPHISEGVPDFMNRGRQRHSPSPPPLEIPRQNQPSHPPSSPPPNSPPPNSAPTPGAAAAIAAASQTGDRNAPAIRANPVLVPTSIHRPATGRPAPDVRYRKKQRSGTMFMIGLLLVLGLGGGAAYKLGLLDRETANANGPTTITSAGGETTLPPGTAIVNNTSCPDDSLPDPDTNYQIKEIAANDKDGGANARSGPGLGADTPPVTVLPSFTPLDVDHSKCDVDNDGRIWWGVNVDGNLLWVSSKLIIPAG